ncbi:MAG: alpha/beta hydrolase [Marinosulfonomonas sp.]|nr:MAG: alpha/beta hydrolase [Marinosulfonomonas sp.]
MLNTITFGQPTDKTPLLISHGLYGSARNWGVIAKRLSDERQVIAVDMRNHGESEWFQTHSYIELADDLAEVIDHHGGHMDVLGHSMGGKAAMMLSLLQPDLIDHLVVADIAPTGYNHTQIHLAEALMNVDLSRVEKRADAGEQLDQIEDPMVRSFLLQSLDLKDKKWRLNLPVLAAEMDKIVGFPDVTGSFEGTTLFLTGQESNYVANDLRPQIKSLFPKAKFAKIPGAGHWLHAEKPREFEAAVRAFLKM